MASSKIPVFPDPGGEAFSARGHWQVTRSIIRELSRGLSNWKKMLPRNGGGGLETGGPSFAEKNGSKSIYRKDKQN
jgi:hypothetical protein